MRRILFLIFIGLGGAAILVWLGAWQVQRLGWKQGVLAQIDARIGDAPVPLAKGTTPERYAPLTAIGTFGEGHLRILASRKTTGAVHRIIRPFEAEGFGRILVDTGWIRDGRAVPPAPSGTLSITGNFDRPNEIDRFTPEPDLTANIWFARDVPAMADALGTEPFLLVLRDAPNTDLGVTPWPVDTAGIPNDHLQYAITWFSLAAIWVGMSAFFLLRTTRSPSKTA